MGPPIRLDEPRMSKSDSIKSHISSNKSRRHIWELMNDCHCAVIGTCLTLSDLRALARKLQVQTIPGYSIDYQLHGFFVKEATNASKAAKMLDKRLNKRYALSIRKARNMCSEGELSEYWTEALDTGEIPGPYWAILSHPAATKKLSEKMFADVHMLSHMIGASNRADIRRLRVIEEQIANAEDRINRQQRQHTQTLAERDQAVDKLRSKIRSIELSTSETVTTKRNNICRCGTIPDLNNEISYLTKNNKAKNTIIDKATERIEQLETLVYALRKENISMELAITKNGKDNLNKSHFDLNGLHILYVGGRQQTVLRLRTLVAGWNGKLTHHDGGIERSIDELANVLMRADAVVFPTDCVSHAAAKAVKRLCNQTMKPFIPLRTSGIASFIASLADRRIG